MPPVPDDDAPSPPTNPPAVARADDAPRGAFDRRSLLVASIAGSASLALGCDDKPSSSPSSALSSSSPAGASGAPAPTGPAAFLPVLGALAARLLPDDDTGPGASAAHVDGFLARVFDDARLAAVHPLLKRGCAFLMRAAQASYGRAFEALTPAEQDELIGKLVDGKMRPDGFSGAMFVRVALALTLEGFLGDPRHGGNKDAIGWRFVGFSPEGRAAGLAQAPPPSAFPPAPTPLSTPSSTPSSSSPPSAPLRVLP